MTCDALILALIYTLHNFQNRAYIVISPAPMLDMEPRVSAAIELSPQPIATGLHVILNEL